MVFDIYFTYGWDKSFNRRKGRQERNRKHPRHLSSHQNHSVRIEKGKMSQKKEKNNEEGGDHYPASLRENTTPSPMPAATFNACILLNLSPISQVWIPVTSPPPRIEQSSVLTCPIPYIQPLPRGHFLPQTVIQLAPITIHSLAPHFEPITGLQ